MSGDGEGLVNEHSCITLWSIHSALVYIHWCLVDGGLAEVVAQAVIWVGPGGVGAPAGARTAPVRDEMRGTINDR